MKNLLAVLLIFSCFAYSDQDPEEKAWLEFQEKVKMQMTDLTERYNNMVSFVVLLKRQKNRLAKELKKCQDTKKSKKL